MGWSLPWGFVWDHSTGGIRKLTDEEMQGAYDQANDNPHQPQNVTGPSPILGYGPEGGDMYKDENGVLRNRTPMNDVGRGSSQNDPRIYAPQKPYATYGPTGGGGEVAVGDGGGGGGGGGGSSGSWFAGSTGTFGGGMNMGYTQNVGGGIRTQFASLNPTVWGASSGAGDAAGGAAAQAHGIAGALTSINPQVPGMPRTLYNEYESMLMNPDKFLQNPVVAAALAKAQQAAGRQLAAGRMSRSGNAAQAISEATAQALMGQYHQMGQTLGSGASLEAGRWGTEAGMNLEALKARIDALKGAGGIAVGAGNIQGDIYKQDIARMKMDLDRVLGGVASPQEEYQAAYQRSLQPVWLGYRPTGFMGAQAESIYGPAPMNVGSYQNWVQTQWGR